VVAGQALARSIRALSGAAEQAKDIGEGPSAIARRAGGLRALQAALSGRRDSQQQLDTQAARWHFEVHQADNATIITPKLQIMYSHITRPSAACGLRLVDMGTWCTPPTRSPAGDHPAAADRDSLQPAEDQLPQVMARMKKMRR